MLAPGLSLHLLRPFAATLTRAGSDGERFLRALGVDADAPADAFVPADAVDRAFDGLAAERDDPALALTLARVAVTYPLGFFDHLVWPGATLRDALVRSSRFYGLFTNRSTLALDERTDGTALLTQHTARGAPRGSRMTEFAFASVVLRARQAASGLTVRAMRFQHACPAELRAVYGTFFQGPVLFEERADSLELDAKELARPLGTADAIAAAALEAEAMRMQDRLTPEDAFLPDVRKVLLQNVTEPAFGLAEVARALRLSQRTVQRRLERRGTTLRALTDEVRRDEALALLGRGASILEVAFALGFAHGPAFHKAFVRWTGTTPGAFVSRSSPRGT